MAKKICNFMAVERGRKLSVTLLKKGVDNLLFLTHKLLTFLEAIRLAFDVNNGAVMQDTIQDGGGNSDIGKNLIPLGEGLIGSEDGGGLLIAPGNQLEEEVSPLNVHREVSNLINNEHFVLGQYFELVWQAVLEMGFFELLNELVAVDVVSRKPMLCRHEA